MALIREQETKIKAFYDDAYEQQVALQAKRSQLAQLTRMLTNLCDKTLAFALNYNSNQALSSALSRNPGLNFDYVLDRSTRITNSAVIESISEMVTNHKDELLSDIAQFIVIASGEIDVQDLSRLTNLSHLLASTFEKANYQRYVRLIDNTLQYFLAELIKHRPLGQASPLLRAAIRYIAWVLGEHLTFWLSKEAINTSQHLDRQRTLETYLNLAVSLALLEERIEEKLLPTEGVVLMRERREHRQHSTTNEG